MIKRRQRTVAAFCYVYLCLVYYFEKRVKKRGEHIAIILNIDYNKAGDENVENSGL